VTPDQIALLILTAAIVGLIAISIGYGLGHRAGRDTGYRDGRAAGYDAGRTRGLQDGRAQGVAQERARLGIHDWSTMPLTPLPDDDGRAT
jgi:hypothetical protein